MMEFKGKVAVITGAASGIGRALAERCAHEGMQVVLADVDVDALTATEAALQATGAPVLAVVTDVSKAQDVESLAQRTLTAFGAVHLLCNNAGVWGGISAWDSSLADWEWILGVNLWGVIHGVHTFLRRPCTIDAWISYTNYKVSHSNGMQAKRKATLRSMG
jgi:NAD(P)-dependent dehydrogenase (short-subunit alcohol dehydrogenase family)